MEQQGTKNSLTKIKICGLTSAEEASWIAQERVDYAGIVVFYPQSRRNRTIAQAREILSALQGARALSGEPIRVVAVTVSPDPAQTEEIQNAGFDRIQIHGTLSEETLAAVHIPVIRAFNGLEREAYEKARLCRKVEAYLFDAGKPGSGKTFDWEVLRLLPRDEKPVFLAGGLDPSNVAEAVRRVEPDAVDVSSGVEKDTRDGKDREKLRAFVRAVRQMR